MNQWYQGYNFLGYGAGFAYITRVVGATALNSFAEVEKDGGTIPTGVAQLIKNKADWDVTSLGAITFGADESLESRVSLNDMTLEIADDMTVTNTGTTDVTLTDGVLYEFITTGGNSYKFTKSGTVTITAAGTYSITEGVSEITDDSNSKLKFFARNPGVWGDSLSVAIANASDFGVDAEAFPGVLVDDQFEYKPTANEIAVLIAKDGIVLETYLVSLDDTAVDYANKSTYIENVINEKSSLVFVKDNMAVGSVASKLSGNTVDFTGGNNGTATASEIMDGYALYENVDEIDVDLIIANEVSPEAAMNLSSLRRDCISYVGATFGTTVGKTAINATQAIIDSTKSGLMNVNTVYSAFYGNYKFQFDKFTGKNVWLNLAGDMAGIRAQTNELQNPWTAAAGIQRGGVKNVKKFAFIPNKAQRDYSVINILKEVA